MNTITVSHHLTEEYPAAIHDVDGCIRSWGRRGILWGGIFGFIVAAILAAVPSSTEVLTFGIIGTMIVGAVECAVIAGGLGVVAAALYGQGVRRTNASGSELTFAADRSPLGADWREDGIPLSDWPARWSFPGSPATQSVLPAADDYSSIIAPSVLQTQMAMSAIDSWENGGCGP